MSTIHVAPPVYVTAPTRTPHRFGLFSAANVVDDPERRFLNGVEFEPISCEMAGGVSGACFDVDDLEENWPDGWPLSPGSSGVDTVLGLPFAVYGWYDCSAFSRPLAEAELRARQHLAAGEERQVERTLVSGAWEAEPNFVGAQDLGGPYPLQHAIGVLEGHLGENYGGPGVIHMPRSLAAPASHGMLLERHGTRLETLLGNYVAAGGGYEVTDDTLYVTSVPTVRRSEVWVNPDPEFRPQRTNNDVTVYAWRAYVVTWECITAKVTVELPEPSVD